LLCDPDRSPLKVKSCTLYFSVAERKKNSEGGNEAEIDDEYMDEEMKEADERSTMRISILFREFKDELESYMPQGAEKPGKF